MKTGYLRSAFITIGSFLLVITAVTAWTGPSGNPPSNNVAAPLNVSATGQQKAGPLGINTNTAPSSGFGLLVGNNALISGKAFVGVSTVDADPGRTLVTKDYMLSKVPPAAPTCASGQFPSWNGSTWTCVAMSGGLSGGAMCDLNLVANPVGTPACSSANGVTCYQSGSRGANTLFARHGAIYTRFQAVPSGGVNVSDQCWNGALYQIAR